MEEPAHSNKEGYLCLFNSILYLHLYLAQLEAVLNIHYSILHTNKPIFLFSILFVQK